MNPALRVENVSKQYRIYPSPGDRLKESLTRGFRKYHRALWALRDVGFEIEAGTTTGIVGPNGSGKSTLLQIITGTLEPTIGNVWYEGSVAALLELGAGFNMEFTGTENVFMNAALLGFSRIETQALLPEIERFAEIGAFINQPVKTYSSGMYVRLAFATAVSTRPKILIIDEALSVGDAVFQHRCLRRIKEMQESGTTILFVSHDPSGIKALCSRAILLNNGRVEIDGEPTEVLNLYQKLIMEREVAYESEKPRLDKPLSPSSIGPDTPKSADLADYAGSRQALHFSFRHGDKSAEVLSAELLDLSQRRVHLVETGAPLLVRVRVQFHKEIDHPVFGFLIRNRLGIHAYGSNTEHRVKSGKVESGEVVEVTFAFDCWLGKDYYSISVAVHSEEGISYDWLDAVLFFRVTSTFPLEGVANLNATPTLRRIGRASRVEDAKEPKVESAR